MSLRPSYSRKTSSTSVALVTLGILLSSCQPEAQEQRTPPTKQPSRLESLSNELSNTLEDAKRALGEVTIHREASDMAEGELEKLFQFEYHVAELPIESNTEQLQEELTALGRQRWECFHVQPDKTVLRLFCKRRPKTYLRYVPRVF